MKLSQKALAAINNRPVIMRLALELKFTEQWINKLIETNKENGHLTTVKAIQIICEETGLTEMEILQEDEIKEAV